MAKQRLSHLQHRILSWLQADWQRMKGTTSSSHFELTQYLSDVDKSNLSRSLVNLESKGYLIISRSEGGLSEAIILNKVVIKG